MQRIPWQEPGDESFRNGEQREVSKKRLFSRRIARCDLIFETGQSVSIFVGRHFPYDATRNC
jgi:hypothetical protein